MIGHQVALRNHKCLLTTLCSFVTHLGSVSLFSRPRSLSAVRVGGEDVLTCQSMYGICQQLILQVNLTTEECLEGDGDNDTGSDGVSSAQGQSHMGRIERKNVIYLCIPSKRSKNIALMGSWSRLSCIQTER